MLGKHREQKGFENPFHQHGISITSIVPDVPSPPCLGNEKSAGDFYREATCDHLLTCLDVKVFEHDKIIVMNIAVMNYAVHRTQRMAWFAGFTGCTVVRVLQHANKVGFLCMWVFSASSLFPDIYFRGEHFCLFSQCFEQVCSMRPFWASGKNVIPFWASECSNYSICWKLLELKKTSAE